MLTPTLFPLIQDKHTLHAFLEMAGNSRWIGVDTEFVRERTYYPLFCLLQISSEHASACIDPLSGIDLSPLESLFSSPHIMKIFHAARQDLEILNHHMNTRMTPIFDTQTAAPFLGFPEQISYAKLVDQLLNIEIDKGQSRTDWRSRPLSEHQLDYAMTDVIHLGTLYQLMRDELIRIHRLEWVEEELLALTSACHQPADPMLAWERVSGLHLVKDSALPALQALAALRETMAREENLPRNWLIKDEVLVEICRRKPADLQALQSIRGLDIRLITRHGRQLLDCLSITEHTSLPSIKRFGKRSPEETQRLERLIAITREQSVATGIASTLLATRRDLESFVSEPAGSKLTQGWRREVVGDALISALQALKRQVVE